MSSELGDVTFGFFPIVTSFLLWPGWIAVLPLLPIGAVITADPTGRNAMDIIQPWAPGSWGPITSRCLPQAPAGWGL